MGLRICGDYKLTVNQESKLYNYSIPKTENLLVTLGGEEKFTKLDMLQACVFLKWLIPVDVVAWRLSLFLWALLSVASESVSNNFGFIQLEKGEIFWKETSNWLQKTGMMLQLTMGELTCECIPLFTTCEWLWSNHHKHFINLASLQCICKLCKPNLVYFLIQIILRALKRDLEQVVLVAERWN